MKSALVLALAASLAFAQSAKDAGKKAPVKAEPAKTETAPAAIKTAAAIALVGNKSSKTFHKPDCTTAAKMKAANKVTFATKAEAEKAGYKACKVCKP